MIFKNPKVQLSGKIFKQGIAYGKAFLAALVVGIVGFVLGLIGPLSGSASLTGVMGAIGFLAGLALYLVLPTLMLHLEWGKGVLTGLVWFGFKIGRASCRERV